MEGIQAGRHKAEPCVYNSLKLERTVAGAFYDNGKLVEIKQAF